MLFTSSDDSCLNPLFHQRLQIFYHSPILISYIFCVKTSLPSPPWATLLSGGRFLWWSRMLLVLPPPPHLWMLFQSKDLVWQPTPVVTKGLCFFPFFFFFLFTGFNLLYLPGELIFYDYLMTLFILKSVLSFCPKSLFLKKCYIAFPA